MIRSFVVILQTGTDTHNQPKTIPIAGAPVTTHSVLQSLIRYATPAKAIRDNVQQYHKEVPIRLRCRVPTSSVSSTKKDIEPPAWEKNEKKKNEYRKKNYPRVRLRISVEIYRKLFVNVNITLPTTFQLNE